MTEKQIDAAKAYLSKKYYNGKPHTPDNLVQPWSEEDKLYQEELSFRSMVNSILIYGGSCVEGGNKWDSYLLPYINGNQWHKVLIPKERALQIIKEQEYDVSQSEIGYAGEDSEGVSYNYCKWADEK